jgi:hypothetical protein
MLALKIKGRTRLEGQQERPCTQAGSLLLKTSFFLSHFQNLAFHYWVE